MKPPKKGTADVLSELDGIPQGTGLHFDNCGCVSKQRNAMLAEFLGS
jgi:hypothetical protein